jgi:hypothetical protein
MAAKKIEGAAVGEAEGAEAAARPARRAAAQTSVTNPVALCSSAGVKASGWIKVGDGRWRGWVTAADGTELEIEELGGAVAGSWRCITDGTVAKTLELLLQRVLR